MDEEGGGGVRGLMCIGLYTKSGTGSRQQSSRRSCFLTLLHEGKRHSMESLGGLPIVLCSVPHIRLPCFLALEEKSYGSSPNIFSFNTFLDGSEERGCED